MEHQHSATGSFFPFPLFMGCFIIPTAAAATHDWSFFISLSFTSLSLSQSHKMVQKTSIAQIKSGSTGRKESNNYSILSASTLNLMMKRRLKRTISARDPPVLRSEWGAILPPVVIRHNGLWLPALYFVPAIKQALALATQPCGDKGNESRYMYVMALA